jgi:hypothetical protein
VSAPPDPDLVLEITAWHDPAAEVPGYEPHSREFTLYWTPVIGPAAASVYRTLTEVAKAAPQRLNVTALAASIGLAPKKGRLVVLSALRRLHDAGLAQVELPSVAPRLRAPQLTGREMRRFPPDWLGVLPAVAGPDGPPLPHVERRRRERGEHAHTPRLPEPPPARKRRRALALLRGGADPDTAVANLLAFGADPQEAAAAVAWAAAQPDANRRSPARARAKRP